MSGSTGVSAQVLELLGRANGQLESTAFAEQIAAMKERLDGPLRIAIAGRVKAGKSTLLNALVGSRVAPTDAGECTRIVSWYRNGQNYEVAARLHNGELRPLRFARGEGSLDVELGELAEADVASLDVQWPTSALAQITLIDTPGLASINDDNSRRTRDFLEADGPTPSDADAVVYLMRHLHTTDVAFLDAYMDRTVPESSPVNAVAVLSRADEIGAGRLDAMESAARIAARYRGNAEVRTLAATVIPVAGLLAETGLTLREDEASSLRAIAEQPEDVLDEMLLSADHFCDLHASDLTVETRQQLVGRLGMFGVRLAIEEIKAGATTATNLAPRLVEASGLGELRRLINEHFLPRARVLQARSVLLSLRKMARELPGEHAQFAETLEHEAERIESSAVEFAQMRAAHLVASGLVDLRDDDRRDLERLLLAGTAQAALQLEPTAGAHEIQQSALAAIERWRAKANDPLATPALMEVYEATARTAEAMYVSAQPT